ncbi:MAG TPA: hypothetical protein VN950_00820 [Terriglobales bacterium]|nr:hypothetical protein [Terriglobales bacterium]
MLQKIRDGWNSLPHPVQAVIMLFGGAALGVLKHKLSPADACLTGECFKGYFIDAAHAGVAAVIALYIPANLPK